MIIAILAVLGLALGSFVNALVWRVHEQADTKNSDKKYRKSLSISKGRSMCPHCKHELTAKDLIPVLSWLSLGGKCRYCRKPVSVQYPLVELATAGLFVASYVWWPADLQGGEWLSFGLWLVLLAGLMALLVYDLRWFLLPDRIVFPLGAVAALLALVEALTATNPLMAVVNTALAVLVGGGLFYGLFQFSKGRWIGGGDVKLGLVLGLIAATPARSLLFIFLAALIGTLISLPLMASKKMSRHSLIPFGPFLIIGLIITHLFGQDLLDWYMNFVTGRY